jgi:hypothetical protein
MDVEGIVGNALASQYAIKLPTSSLNIVSLQWQPIVSMDYTKICILCLVSYVPIASFPLNGLHCLSTQFFHLYKFLVSPNCLLPLLKNLFCSAYYMIQCFINGRHSEGRTSTSGDLMAMVVATIFDFQSIIISQCIQPQTTHYKF